MCSPDIIVDILLMADQYNGSYTKTKTVNHIADYEVPVHISCSALVILSNYDIPLVSSTYYGILQLCNLILKSYLFLVIIWTTIVVYNAERVA